MTDTEFLSQLAQLTLPPSAFGHAGHLRLARLYLQAEGCDDAVARTCAAIRAYACHLGAPGKFNWTLTEALVRLLAAHGGVLDGDARALVARHYSAALLGSAAAREAFVAPDLAPLPA